MTNLSEADLMARTERALAVSGGLYTFADIVDAINEGRMQSFSEGDTWVVTQVDHFPRRTVVNITLVVGNLEEAKTILPRVYDLCKQVGADRITGFGRSGWWHHADKGWVRTGTLYHKDLTNGS